MTTSLSEPKKDCWECGGTRVVCKTDANGQYNVPCPCTTQDPASLSEPSEKEIDMAGDDAND